MRSPQRRRPLVRRIVSEIPEEERNRLAKSVRYVGSPEHKDTPSFAGRLRPRSNASMCPREMHDRLETVQRWLETAVLAGAVGGIWEGGFPRYVWFQEGEVVYEGRLVNRLAGTYKGYPLNRDEWPDGLEAVYG